MSVPQDYETADGLLDPTAMEVLPHLETRGAVLEPGRVFEEEDLRRAMHRLADCGWNTIVLPFLFGGYTIFSTQTWADYGMRRQHPAFRGWDPAAAAFDVAADRNLEVLLGFSPYRVQTDGGRRSPVLRKHPKWGARRHPNRKRRVTEDVPADTYYCPVNREHRRFLGDTLNVVLDDYPFHGLLIDLRHYPFYAGSEKYVPWCYCDVCRRQTLDALGFDPVEVDFSRERAMVERWKEWQTQQMDEALAYLRMRALKARRTMRILGLLTTDSGLAADRPRPLLHWKTWVERSLVEALVLDGYAPESAGFDKQLRADVKTLPPNSLLLPMIPRKATEPFACLATVRDEPLPGLMSRFENWEAPDFDPAARLRFEEPAAPAESDPIQSICLLFEGLARDFPHHAEFGKFLRDLSRVLMRADVDMQVDRLLMVAENVRGLWRRVRDDQLDFGRRRNEVLHALDLACRLAYLSGGDLTE